MQKSSLPFFEAVAVLLGSTIGAGILGLPFAVAKVGWLIGAIYIVCLGAVMIGLNLMLGEVALRTKEPMQVAGLAGKYLGHKGKTFMTIVMFSSSFGALLAYLIGEGYILQSFFGGNVFWWSLIFWMVGAIFVYFGLSLIKKLDVILTLIILATVLIIIFISAPSVNLPNLTTVGWAGLFFPFGVILAAFSGASGIPQMEAILPHEQKKLKTAIVVAGIVIILAYLLFMTAVLGITGIKTTEVATIGLGNKLGSKILMLVNLFAFFAMGTCFLNYSLAIRNVFRWDYKMSRFSAWLWTVSVPVFLFILGLRDFITILDFVGGVIGSFFAILVIAIFWQAKRKGDLPITRYGLHHTLLLSIIIIIVFAIASIYSLIGRG